MTATDVLVAATASALLAAGTYLAVAAHLYVRWSRRAWTSLERIGPELVGQLEETAILRLALSDGLTLFRCDAAAVVLYPRPGQDGLIASLTSDSTGQAQDQVQVMPLRQSELPPHRPEGVIETPLHGAGEAVGRLTVHVGHRRGRRARRRLMTAYAHLLSTSLVTARMYASQRRHADRSYERTLKDGLTGLGNRSLLEHQTPRYLATAAAHDRHAALLMLDLNDFKRINDTLGHDAGDRVLKEVGRRVLATVRENDLAVRLGGDEFAVLTTELGSEDEADRVADRLLRALTPTIRVYDVDLEVRASVGVAVQGQSGDSLDELLRAADSAMYDAKAAGGGVWRRASRRSAPQADEPALDAAALERALAGDELVLHYQPQVDAKDGAVVGFEALVRWHHPQLGLLAPNEFVPLADRYGLTNELLSTVLSKAVSDHVTLRSLAPDSSMAVNVSARNLLAHGLVADVERILLYHDAPASSLTLEISEPAPGSSASVAAALSGIERLGCRVSIQEYGTGNSSLTALNRYHAVREIKVAPGLVAGVTEDPSAERLVRVLVNTAHDLDVRVVAEGIESWNLACSLRGLGCDVLQGFHILPAAPLGSLLPWLAEWPERRDELLLAGPRTCQ